MVESKGGQGRDVGREGAQFSSLASSSRGNVTRGSGSEVAMLRWRWGATEGIVMGGREDSQPLLPGGTRVSQTQSAFHSGSRPPRELSGKGRGF